MNIFDRIIFTFTTLILSVISILLIIIPFDIVELQGIFSNDFISYTYKSYWIAVLGIFLFVFCLKVLISGFSKSNKKNAFIYPSSYGEIKITAKTIDGLISGVTSDIVGITDIKTKVKFLTNGVCIQLKGLVNQSINIPETATNIQKKVKEYIETYTGLEVIDIKVEISNISTAKKALN